MNCGSLFSAEKLVIPTILGLIYWLWVGNDLFILMEVWIKYILLKLNYDVFLVNIKNLHYFRP